MGRSNLGAHSVMLGVLGMDFPIEFPLKRQSKSAPKHRKKTKHGGRSPVRRLSGAAKYFALWRGRLPYGKDHQVRVIAVLFKDHDEWIVPSHFIGRPTTKRQLALAFHAEGWVLPSLNWTGTRRVVNSNASKSLLPIHASGVSPGNGERSVRDAPRMRREGPRRDPFGRADGR
jgi:hypothetical protein